MCALDRPFRSVALPVAPLGDFLNAEKVTKDAHRERVFPLKGLSRWAAVATFYLNEPSPATTEGGSRSPFWNPLRVVQCLPLPMNFLAKIDLAQKRLWFVEALPSLGGNQRGTAHGSSLAVQGWGFKRGGENAIPAPFVILCILSVHTESMPAERVGSESMQIALIYSHKKAPLVFQGELSAKLTEGIKPQSFIVLFPAERYCFLPPFRLYAPRRGARADWDCS